MRRSRQRAVADKLTERFLINVEIAEIRRIPRNFRRRGNVVNDVYVFTLPHRINAVKERRRTLQFRFSHRIIERTQAGRRLAHKRKHRAGMDKFDKFHRKVQIVARLVYTNHRVARRRTRQHRARVRLIGNPFRADETGHGQKLEIPFAKPVIFVFIIVCHFRKRISRFVFPPATFKQERDSRIRFDGIDKHGLCARMRNVRLVRFRVVPALRYDILRVGVHRKSAGLFHQFIPVRLRNIDAEIVIPAV